MPMREQSRISANTEAEECTCEECPARAPDIAPSGFRIVGRSGPRSLPLAGQWVQYIPTGHGPRDAPAQVSDEQAMRPAPVFREWWDAGRYQILEPIPAPAPEPSAPPTGVPVCHPNCGKYGKGYAGDESCPPGCFGTGTGRHWCSMACADALRPLNPPPASDPVMTDEGPVTQASPETARMVAAMTPKWPPSAPVTVATGGDECPGCDDHCEDEKCKAAHGPCVDAAVATGGVPAGFRLGAGWVVDRTYLCSCTGCRQNTSTEYYKPRSCGKGACAAHAVRMGAIVPDDTARSVPPGPVPVEAPRCTEFDIRLGHRLGPCQLPAGHYGQCDGTEPAPPAAPASEPAVRPLSERLVADLELVCEDDLHEWRVRVAGWGDKVAALEADLAEAKRRHAGAAGMYQVVSERWKASRAEVEQLRGKLAEERARFNAALDSAADRERQATARVRSMREAAALIADRHEYGRTRECLCNACKSGREIRALSDDQPVPAKQAESLEAGRSVALPLDTGTATGFGPADLVALLKGEHVARCSDARDRECGCGFTFEETVTVLEQWQADAIKAAVDKERERCLAWADFWVRGYSGHVFARMLDDIRSCAAAPGAVGK